MNNLDLSWYGGWSGFELLVSFNCLSDWQRSVKSLLQENFQRADVFTLYHENIFLTDEAEKEFREVIKNLNKEYQTSKGKSGYEFLEITGEELEKFRNEHIVNVLCAFRKIDWKRKGKHHGNEG